MYIKSLFALLAAAVLGIALPASAATLVVHGTTTGGPTFNRPLEDLSDRSLLATAARYDALTFTVGTSGSYSFQTLADNTAAFDTFAILYRSPFNSATPLVNALIANDDSLDIGIGSGFSTLLTAGLMYTYVTTGFTNTDFGGFTTTINGPGVIAAVPEPETVALMALGLGLVAYRRRSARSSS